jgi:hypothetical protein
MQATLSVSKYKQSRAIILRDDEGVRSETANKFMAESELSLELWPGRCFDMFREMPGNLALLSISRNHDKAHSDVFILWCILKTPPNSRFKALVSRSER